MSALPDVPLVTAQQYLASSFPDGDREFVDGVIVERNVGTPGHSLLQKILIGHLLGFEKELEIRVLPVCRTRIAQARYRIPDILVMLRPFRKNGRVVLDPPLLVIEILSPDDTFKDMLQRFRDYQEIGVRYSILLDPEGKTAFLYVDGGLVPREFSVFEVPGRGSLPFDSRELFAKLDEELNES